MFISTAPPLQFLQNTIILINKRSVVKFIKGFKCISIHRSLTHYVSPMLMCIHTPYYNMYCFYSQTTVRKCNQYQQVNCSATNPGRWGYMLYYTVFSRIISPYLPQNFEISIFPSIFSLFKQKPAVFGNCIPISPHLDL